jgi:hypothetical protein
MNMRRVELMAEKHTEVEKVRVYDLVNPGLLKAHEADLKWLFFDVVGGRPDALGTTFSVSPVSGWIYFEDGRNIRSNAVRMLLPQDQSKAKAIADQFLSDLHAALADNKKYPFLKELADVEILPSQAKVIEASAVVGSNGSDAEHWIVRCEVALRGYKDMRDKLVVQGSQIEIRLGDHGQVVGFCSRWTPVSRTIRYADFIPYQDKDGHAHDASGQDNDGHAHSSEGKQVGLPEVHQVYCLKGDGVPQFYLAPYHSVLDGHHSKLSPASTLSLELRFNQFHSKEEMVIEAAVDGGSGDFSYHWGHYQLESVWDEGVVDDQNDVPYLRISPPCYAVVMLHVLDRKTGAYCYHSEQVVGHPQYEVLENAIA